jgi:hypothetical protein
MPHVGHRLKTHENARFEPITRCIRLKFIGFSEPINGTIRLMPYHWQQADWPQFRYDLSGLEEVLLELAEKTGKANGLFLGLTAEAQMEAEIEMMLAEGLRTSAIEGELLSRQDVRSSIRRNL